MHSFKHAESRMPLPAPADRPAWRHHKGGRREKRYRDGVANTIVLPIADKMPNKSYPRYVPGMTAVRMIRIIGRQHCCFGGATALVRLLLAISGL